MLATLVVAAAGAPGAAAATDPAWLHRQVGVLRRAALVRPEAAATRLPAAIAAACTSDEALLRRAAAQSLVWWPRADQALPPLRRLEQEWLQPRWRSADTTRGRYITTVAIGLQEARLTGLRDPARAEQVYLSRCQIEAATLQRAGKDSTLLRLHSEYALCLQGIAVLLSESAQQGVPTARIRAVRERYSFDLVPEAKLRDELAPLSSQARVELLHRRLANSEIGKLEYLLDAQALADEGLHNAKVRKLLEGSLREYARAGASAKTWRIKLMLSALGALGDRATLPAVEPFLKHPEKFVRWRAGWVRDALKAGEPFPAAVSYL